MSCNRVLVSVDLNEHYDVLIDKAISLVNKDGLTIVNVMETWNYLLVAGGVDWGAEANVAAALEHRLRSQDEEKMKKIREQYNLPEDSTILAEGKPADEIKRLASDKGCDLIICGTHGRKGLGKMLGSVSNGIVHGAPCDVLTVKL